MIIKQFGLQRSGTNYTKHLLVENYNVKVMTNSGGWKHGYYRAKPIPTNEVDVIITIKNPYAWLVSVYNYFNPHPRNISLKEFIRREYKFEGMRNKSPIIHWNTMNNHWCNLMLWNHKVVVVKYENLLIDAEKYCDIIATELNLKRTRIDFYDPKMEIMANALEHPDKKFNREYYIQKKYMDEFSDDDIYFIKNQLDKNLTTRFYENI